LTAAFLGANRFGLRSDPLGENYVMKRIAALALCGVLCGCGSSGGGGAGQDVRQLTPDERAALGHSMAQALRSPDTGQFKWMPVIIGRKNAPTRYCGLVNATNSAGVLVGFRKFAATIAQGSSETFERGAIEHVEGAASIFTSPIDDAPQSGGTGALCQSWGYVNFGLAN
jgi:hypothetical protein